MRRLLTTIPLLAVAGCAGYAADYWKPKQSIVGEQLMRYGLEASQAQCMNAQLTKSLSVWQLRQLSDLASRTRASGSRTLGPTDLRYVTGLAEDPQVGIETGRALDACVAAAPMAAAVPTPTPVPAGTAAEPPKPLRWIDLGAAETGQAIAVDITSVAMAGTIREGWFRLTNPGEAAPQPVAYRLRIDCPGKVITPTAARKYGPDGAVTEQRDYATSGGDGPLAVEAGTVMEIAHRKLCT